MAGIRWWTEERLGRLASLAAAGCTAREIARCLETPGRAPTAEAVRQAARAAGIRLLARGARPRNSWSGTFDGHDKRGRYGT